MSDDTRASTYYDNAGRSVLQVSRPNGPVVVIKEDGTVAVQGEVSEGAKMFWDAVQLHGVTYREQIQALKAVNEELKRQVVTLLADPYRKACQDGYNIIAHLPKENRRGLTQMDISAVLTAIDEIARTGVN